MRRAASLFATFFALGCGDRTGLIVPSESEGPSDATVDVARHRDASQPEDASLPDARVIERDAESALCKAAPDAGSPPFPDACGSTLHVVSITPSSSTCFLDLALATGADGALTVFCRGGYSSADFGKGLFEGNFTGGFVEVCRGTTFKYNDGCTWVSAQRISGTLASGTLTFEYGEAPITGSPCASACTATGVIVVK
jgi:hypothetical protein